MTKQFATAIGAGILLFACGGSDDGSDLFGTGGGAGAGGSSAGSAGTGTGGSSGSAAGGSSGSGGDGGSSVGGSSGSSAGSSGAGGDGGSSTGGSAGSGTGGSAGSGTGGSAGSGTGGSAGSGTGGSAGSGTGGSAGSGGSGTGGAGGCTAVTWCKDGDVDTYGDPATEIESCTSPGAGYVAKASKPRACEDCNDANEQAHPNSTHCDGAGYDIGNGKVSFDFNCDGKEVPCHDFVKAALNGCKLDPVSGAGCTGSGYLPTSRSGPGVDPYCGSDEWRQCTLSGNPGSLFCAPTVVQYNPVTCK